MSGFVARKSRWIVSHSPWPMKLRSRSCGIRSGRGGASGDRGDQGLQGKRLSRGDRLREPGLKCHRGLPGQLRRSKRAEIRGPGRGNRGGESSPVRTAAMSPRGPRSVGTPSGNCGRAGQDRCETGQERRAERQARRERRDGGRRAGLSGERGAARRPSGAALGAPEGAEGGGGKSLAACTAMTVWTSRLSSCGSFQGSGADRWETFTVPPLPLSPPSASPTKPPASPTSPPSHLLCLLCPSLLPPLHFPSLTREAIRQQLKHVLSYIESQILRRSCSVLCEQLQGVDDGVA